jgi:hypothetical protein
VRVIEAISRTLRMSLHTGMMSFKKNGYTVRVMHRFQCIGDTVRIILPIAIRDQTVIRVHIVNEIVEGIPLKRVD